MKRGLCGLSLLMLALACIFPVYAKAPVKISEVAPAADLIAEADAKIAALEGYLGSEDSFLQAREDHAIAQAAGVLACLAQGIAEHEEKSPLQSAAAGLREAALKLRDSTTLAEGRKALEQVKQARGGESVGEAAVEHDWAKLIDMDLMMEEVNFRNSRMRRVIRRPKDPQQDSLHATTLAVLALAMHADTHEVKDKAAVAQWQKYSIEYQQTMSELAAAMKKKDTATSRKLHLKGAMTCNACHEDFRDN